MIRFMWIGVIMMLAACTMPTPDVRPAPGDNVLRVEIHVYGITPGGTDVLEVRRTVKARVTAVNGAGIPLVGDDGKPMSNWRHDTTGALWKLELSQPASAGSARGMIINIRARVGEQPGDSHLNIVCTFYVNGVEDVAKAQAGVGPEIVCLYSTSFS